MLPWIKRLHDWAMLDFGPLFRTGPQMLALRVLSEKAGLTLDNQAIPWNAEVVLVEATARLPEHPLPKKSDFLLHLATPNGATAAEQIARAESKDCWRFVFRLPVPTRTTTAELRWHGRSLAQLTLPVLGEEEFGRRLNLSMPNLYVSLGEQTVPCRTYVSSQCHGLNLTAVLSGPTSLVPLADQRLHVEFRSEKGFSFQDLPIQLSSSQLQSPEAVVTVVPRKPRRIGTWLAVWKLGEKVLATQKIKVISKQQFEKSLGMAGLRFVSQDERGEVCVTRHVPLPDQQSGARGQEAGRHKKSNGVARLGPCFLVSSSEVGMAGLCKLQVRARIDGSLQSPLLQEQEVLITDGPVPFAPGTLAVEDLEQVAGFELRLRDRLIGFLPMTPAPAAHFTTEGSFQPPPEFAWSTAAEEQLAERLSRLLRG
jgi:hypothetical protein